MKRRTVASTAWVAMPRTCKLSGVQDLNDFSIDEWDFYVKNLPHGHVANTMTNSYPCAMYKLHWPVILGHLYDIPFVR